jgi:hypothetical protein
MTAPDGTRRVLLTSLAALLAALVLLVLVVLPAEYGWDPLGSGEALGLLGLSGEVVPLPLREQPEGYRRDRVEFQLSPFEFVEYGYRMAEGAGLVYSWRASGTVLYNFHSQPDGMAPDYAESFARARAAAHSGTYLAPFDGTHGWFFQNRGEEDVTITLEVSGFISDAEESNEGGSRRRELPPPVQP